MTFTKEQLRAIFQLIHDYHAAFVVSTLAVRGPLSDKDVERLKRKGLITDDLRKPLQDAYLFGKLQQILGDKKVRRMTLDQFFSHIRSNPVPLTEIEVRAIRAVSKDAAKHIQGMERRVKNRVKEIIAENIRTRGTVKDLAVALKKELLGFSRDFERIAFTEKHNAFQEGAKNYIKQNFDKDVRVIKLPAPDACQWCRSAYLKPDGTPRYFRIGDLGENNVGKKPPQWQPVVGSHHPWCQCVLLVVPDGYEWDVKKRGLRYTGMQKSQFDPILQEDGTYNYAYQGQLIYEDRQKKDNKEAVKKAVALAGVQNKEEYDERRKRVLEEERVRQALESAKRVRLSNSRK